MGHACIHWWALGFRSREEKCWHRVECRIAERKRGSEAALGDSRLEERGMSAGDLAARGSSYTGPRGQLVWCLSAPHTCKAGRPRGQSSPGLHGKSDATLNYRV